MKKVFIAIALGIFLVMSVGYVYAFEAVYGPNEVLYYDSAKSYGGYHMFEFSGQTVLIDMQGRIVHTWDYTGNPEFTADGTLLVGQNEVYYGDDTEAYSGFLELDWDSNIVQAYNVANRPEYAPHHDRVKTPNSTIITIAHQPLTEEECLANGSDPDNVLGYVGGFGIPGYAATPCAVLEIDSSNNVIWRWGFWDHIIQDYDPTKLNYGDRTDPANYGRLDINIDSNTKTGLSQDWNHCNSVDYNPVLDQIVMNSREHGEIYVYDHSLSEEDAATRAGDFVFRWGNPANYSADALPPTFNGNGYEQLFGAHDIHWIPEGLPGAGDFLIYENGSYRPDFAGKSYSYQIHPYDGDMEGGVYVKEMDGGYSAAAGMLGVPGLQWTSNQIVWQWSTDQIGASMGTGGFFCPFISGTRRLPNGNTILTSGCNGHYIEVTPEHEVVWEYVVPLAYGSTVNGPCKMTMTFRSHRYGADHPGLAGQDLTPGATITGRPVGPADAGGGTFMWHSY